MTLIKKYTDDLGDEGEYAVIEGVLVGGEIVTATEEFDYDDSYLQMGSENLEIVKKVGYETGPVMYIWKKIDQSLPGYVFMYYSYNPRENIAICFK